MFFETRATSAATTEGDRRQDLIRATQRLVAEGGPITATVRAISTRAGVTQGLIRHYFGSKEALLREAYVSLMEAIAEKARDAIEGVGAEPEERLAAFVASMLRAPVMDPGVVSLWAGYLHGLRRDPGLFALHDEYVGRSHQLLQSLIAALARPEDSPARQRRDAIACKAVIDGLWLEGALMPHRFAEGEPVRVALGTIGAILGTDLCHPSLFVPELLQSSQPDRRR